MAKKKRTKHLMVPVAELLSANDRQMLMLLRGNLQARESWKEEAHA